MRFHIGLSFNWKTIKKWLIPIAIALAVYLGFNSMTVYAIEDGSSTTYINNIQFFINGVNTTTTEFKTLGAGDLKMSVDGAFVLGSGDSIPKYIYQRITLCIDEYTSAGWNNVNNYEVYAQHTSISCGYYGSSAKGHVVFVTSKVETDTDIAPGRLYNSLYVNVYNTASIGLLGLEFATQPFPIYYENDTVFKQNEAIIDKLEESIEANGSVSYKIDETNEKLDETNQKLDDLKEKQEESNKTQEEIKDAITDSNVDTNTGNSFFDNFSTEDNGGISGIITAPLTLINSLLDNQGTCTDLEFPIMGKDVAIPSGCIIWDKVPNSIETIIQMLVCGTGAYFILTKLFKDINNLKDPNKSEVSTLDL